MNKNATIITMGKISELTQGGDGNTIEAHRSRWIAHHMGKASELTQGCANGGTEGRVSHVHNGHRKNETVK
jgi:hypothetical protein